MDHFSASAWFEYSRNLLRMNQNAAMANHLGSCAECQKLLASWREVFEIGSRELSYVPPQEAVRLAKAIFPSQRTWKQLHDLAELAQLLFDSLREPAPAEVRGSVVSSRQFLHEAKPFMIDLRLECEPAKNMVRLNGQVLNSNEPDQDVADIDVFLMKGDHLATRTRGNSSGEFDLDFPQDDGLQLFVDIRGHKVVEVQLPGSFADCNGNIQGTE